LWDKIHKLISKFDLCLVIVSNSNGSSPGKKGFKMLIDHSGRVFGTIGGGIMEAKVISNIIPNLGRQGIYREILVHRKNDENASGLQCSGNQEIILIYFSPADQSEVTNILNCFQTNTISNLIITKDKLFVSGYTTEGGINEVSNALNVEILYHEIIGNPHKAYIFGAGHVGSAISSVLSFLDFKVTIFDPREEAKSFQMERKFGDLKIGKYEDLHSEIIEGKRTFVIITSNSIDNDIEALKYCINKKLAYIGFMGSKKKIQIAKQALGVDFSNVNAPIGIKIPNKTPEEIAISVAAEIIQIKNS